MSARKAVRVWLALCCAFLLSASAQAATLTLQWDRNSEPDVQGYIIKYGTQSGLYTVEVNVGNQITHTLTLTPTTTTTYYFVVQAFNATTRSANSAQVSTTISATATSQSMLTVDRPFAGSVLPSDLLLSGWSLDRAATTGTGIDAVHVYAFRNPGSGATPTFLGVASYGGSRPDVGAAYGSRFVNSGFSLPVVGLAVGTYDLAFYGRSTVTGTFNVVQTRRVIISAAPPITGPVAATGLPAMNAVVRNWLSIGGWALDVRSTSGPGMDVVQVWGYPSPGSGQAPVFLGNAQYSIVRQDVANAFGNSRYRTAGFYMDVMSMPAGVWDIVVMPRSTVTGAVRGCPGHAHHRRPGRSHHDRCACRDRNEPVHPSWLVDRPPCHEQRRDRYAACLCVSEPRIRRPADLAWRSYTKPVAARRRGGLWIAIRSEWLHLAGWLGAGGV